jgi:hypothetical protein
MIKDATINHKSREKFLQIADRRDVENAPYIIRISSTPKKFVKEIVSTT